MTNKINMILVITLFSIIMLMPDYAKGREIFSHISGKSLKLNDTPYAYSFLVAGHVYGTPSASLFPASSLLANIENFNDMNLEFIMLLGDVIQHLGAENGIGELETTLFKKFVADKLNAPIFNSPGNHDYGNPELYKKYFGNSYFHFQNSSEVFIVLDTELVTNQIEGIQLEYLLELLNISMKNDEIRNIFIFLHRTLWAVNNSPVNTINPWVNGPIKRTANQFEEIVLPKLIGLSKDKNIYILSGDIGIKNYKLGKFPQESFPIFYYEEIDHNITYLACGLAENENDVVIKVDISIDGNVNFYPISLLGKDLGAISQYGINHWSGMFSKIEQDNNPKKIEPSFIRSLLLLVKRVLINKYFLLGNVFSGGLIIICLLLYKYYKRRWVGEIIE